MRVRSALLLDCQATSHDNINTAIARISNRVGDMLAAEESLRRDASHVLVETKPLGQPDAWNHHPQS